MINIILDSGIKVHVTNFLFGYTYSGCYAYTPNSDIATRYNHELVKELAKSNWGESKVLLIMPSKEEFKTKLKRCYYHALLDSKPFKPDYDGSTLLVVWFDDAPVNRSIKEIIEKGIKYIDWKNNARDFHL